MKGNVFYRVCFKHNVVAVQQNEPGWMNTGKPYKTLKGATRQRDYIVEANRRHGGLSTKIVRVTEIEEDIDERAEGKV